MNSEIALAAVPADVLLASPQRWDFFCECGGKDCLARVTLTLADYAIAREAGTGTIVAGGHTLLMRARDARRRSAEARAEAAALRAQAEQIHRRYGSDPSR